MSGEPALERRDVLLEREAGRILHPRVLEPLVLAELVVEVGRGGVDRHGDRAGRRIRMLPGMDGTGRKAARLRIAFHG